MATPTSSSNVIIVGAGLAGLSLGQGLKRANIPFHIYERDGSAGFRAQGYRIRISPEGTGALQRLLPEHLWNAFQATCAEAVQGGAQLDALTGEKTTRPTPGPPPSMRPSAGPDGQTIPGGKAYYNADRVVLRSVLLSGLEDYVSFGKKFERYEASEGRVTAQFSDGTSADGNLLIGADGVRSVVRRQLLPDFTVLDTEGRAVFGKSPLTDKLREQMPKEIGRGLVLASEKPDSKMKLFTDGMAFDRERGSPFEQQLGLHIPADYIYWVLVFRLDVVDTEAGHSLLSLDNQQSVQMSLDLTSDWHPSLRAILQQQTLEAASTLAFLTVPPGFVSEWAARSTEVKGSVTLLGDSAHPMPPVGGVGANAGFQDAVDLLDALKQFETASDREQLVHDYEDKMLARSKIAVERSSGGAGHFFGMKALSELKPAVMWH